MGQRDEEQERVSSSKTCWGIYRESAHSPGRVDDDAAIMRRVAEALSARGFNVELLTADDVEPAFRAPGALIFAMCEQGDILDRLKKAGENGAIVVNSPEAIRNTYRHRMVELFAQRHVLAPVSHVVATNAIKLPPATSVWIKRYDFHATQSDDVMYVASEIGFRQALGQFAERGIPFVVAQEHVEGDLIKFYGVGRACGEPLVSDWFEWFYHRDKGMTGYAFAVDRLRQVCRSAAAALGVEIFGGDAIIRRDGEPVIIDLNAWPSYAKFRDKATQAIADYLAHRFHRGPRAVI
jgi:glutathione synthase/RimK-type ligase-like ATP-grasp enzyme